MSIEREHSEEAQGQLLSHLTTLLLILSQDVLLLESNADVV